MFGVVTDDVSAGDEDLLGIAEAAAVDGLLLEDLLKCSTIPQVFFWVTEEKTRPPLSARDTLPGTHIAPSIV